MKAGNMDLEKKLEYEFKDKEILDNALRHSSFVNEQPHTNLKDNECLEFLGDAVLNLTIGHILMKHYPEFKEGMLSRMRANLVNESQLALIAREIDLGNFIYLGKGELQTNGRGKNSILADTFEAVLAAIYLDGGFDAAFKIVERHFLPLLDSISFTTTNTDYKSQLQELVQGKYKAAPIYKVISETGPDHDKTFEVQLNAWETTHHGTGKSKKIAEQDAAKNALEILKKQ
jgi:ribonuclease III